MFKKFIAFLVAVSFSLAVCLVPASANAGVGVLIPPGTEGAILGGGSAAAALGLSASSVCLVAAAAFGIYIAYENREEICADIKTAVDAIAAAYNVADDKLDQFWADAAAGVIDTTSQVWDCFREWATSLYQSAEYAGAGTFLCPPGQNGRILLDGSTVPFYKSTKVLPTATLSDGITAHAFISFASSRNIVYRVILCGNMAFNFDGVAARFDDDINLYLLSLSEFNSSGTFSPPIDTSFWYTVPFDMSDGLNWIQHYFLSGVGIYGNYQSIGPVSDMYDSNPDLLTGYDVAGVDGQIDLHDLVGNNGAVYDGGADVWSGGDAALADGLDLVLDGALTWGELMDIIGAIPFQRVETPVLDDEGNPVLEGDVPLTIPVDVAVTDDGITDVVIDDPTAVDPDPGGGGGSGGTATPYAVDLRGFFPFCIPFDIYNMATAFVATPEAPHFTLKFYVPITGQLVDVDIDLSAFNTIAQLLRDLEIILFCVGLAVATKKLILNGGAG